MLFFGVAKGLDTKRSKNDKQKIAVILSKEARCFVVFWCGKGPGYKAKKKNAPSFYFAAIRSFNSIEVPSSRGGRSEAQHNAPRQGSAMPTIGVPDHSQRCAEQKQKAKLKLSLKLN